MEGSHTHGNIQPNHSECEAQQMSFPHHHIFGVPSGTKSISNHKLGFRYACFTRPCHPSNPVKLVVLDEGCLSELQLWLSWCLVSVMRRGSMSSSSSLQSVTALPFETSLPTTPAQPREGKKISRAALAGSPSLTCCPPKLHSGKKRGEEGVRWNTRADVHTTTAGPLKSGVYRFLCHYRADRGKG